MSSVTRPTGLLTTCGLKSTSPCGRRSSLGSSLGHNRTGSALLRDSELAFLGDPFKSLSRALNPILAIVALGRKLPDDLIGTGGGRTRNIARSKVHGRSNREFVLQRPLHHARCRPAPTVPLRGRLENRWLIACAVANWPAVSRHGKRTNSLLLSMRWSDVVGSGANHAEARNRRFFDAIRPNAEVYRRGLRDRPQLAVGGPISPSTDRRGCCTWPPSA